MRTPPWWDEVRTPIAFVVAPFVVPLTVAVSFPSRGPQDTAAAIAVAASAIIAYAGTFVFGVPTYLFLRSHGVTAFWFAPVAGFIAGALSMSIIGGVTSDALMFSGLCGAVVGAVLWLIARPDRQSMMSTGRDAGT